MPYTLNVATRSLITAVKEGRETAAVRTRGRDLLTRMELGTRITFPSTNLSGRQKQRVAVARALISRPELVLADEPTGNRDSASAMQLLQLIGQINCDEGKTILISTHDDKIASLCQRQIVVGGGVVTGSRSARHDTEARSHAGRIGVKLVSPLRG